MDPHNNSDSNTQSPTEPNIANSDSGSTVTAAASVPAPITTNPVAPVMPGDGSGAMPASSDSAGPSPIMNTMSAPSSGSKKGWLLPVIVAVVVLMALAGGYVFGLYLPNRPSAVFSKSLTNSGKAVDALVDYSKAASKLNYKSTKFDGTLHVKSSVSFDATITGAADSKGNTTANLSADILGEKVGADLRTVMPAGGTTPDIYLRLTGIKQALDSEGFGSFDSLDSQWVSIDHTLLDSVAGQLNQSAVSATSATSLPSRVQVEDAIAKIQAVNRQYIFTTNSSTAVLKQSSYLGKETQDGRSVYHYKVSYDRAHLKAYVSALGTALDSSSLNDWAKSANDGQSLSKLIDISSLNKSINSADTSYKFDVWVDAKTKLVHSVQFAQPSQTNTDSLFTISQNYTGGDTYPFTVSVSDKTSNGTKEHATLKLSVNKTTNKVSADLDVGLDGVTVTGNFTATPSNDAVSVTAPTGAKLVLEILNQLGLSQSDF
ncbi:MAG TPA: hypothetical protein VLF69_03305 [Candidatus Saccharimonadales bacterium]|nr:hypothetical protein [Candidatus Saccharimonadales bacterium]